MTGSEQAVRAKTLALLSGDEELAGLVHDVFDGVPPRASAPYVSVGAAEASDWGTKDRAGREVRLTLVLTGAGSSLDDRAAARIEAVAGRLRGAAGEWSIIAVRMVRTRFALLRGGGWRHEIILRCRCLAAG